MNLYLRWWLWFCPTKNRFDLVQAFYHSAGKQDLEQSVSDLIVSSSKGYRIEMPFLRAIHLLLGMANWFYDDAKFVQHGNRDHFNGVDPALSAYK